MKYQLFKYIFIILLVFFSASPAYAGYCDNYDPDEPTLSNFLCPVVRIVNVVVGVAGVLLIALIVFGGIKLSMSFGDPKGLAGATLSWTWMVIGFLIIVGFFVIYMIVVNLFGIDSFSSPDGIFSEILLRWDAFLRSMCIVGNASHCSS